MIYGGGEEKTLYAAGDAVSFELDGETHTIRMTSWTEDPLKAIFELDGVSYTKAANSAITIDPETNSQITIKKVEKTLVPSAAGGAATEGAQATIFVGSAKLSFDAGDGSVKKGDDTIEGASVEMVNTTQNKITKMKVSYVPDEEVAVEVTAAFTDPILGAFDFVLTGMTPALESSSRDYMILSKNGKRIKMTVPTKDGNTLAVNVYEVTAANAFTLEVDNKKFHINDTQYGVDTTHYVLVSDGEYSNILQYKSMDTTDNLMKFRDVGSGDEIEVSFDASAGTGDMYIGSAVYSITNVNTGDKTFTLSAWAGTGTYVGNIPVVSRNGASVTLMSGASGAEFPEPAQINVSERDLIETESPSSAVDMIVNFTAKDTIEIDSVSLSNSPDPFEQVGDTDVNAGLTKYGTLVKKDTDADSVKLWYPDEQAYANVYVMKSGVSPPTTTTTGTEVSQTVEVEAPSLGTGIAKLDSGVSSVDKQEKNMILVGGPAANNLVKELATAGKTPDMAYWLSDLQGKFILQAVEDAFEAGRTAIVVAGWEAAETQEASLKLATEDLSGAAVSCMGTTCSDFVYPVEEEEASEEE